MDSEKDPSPTVEPEDRGEPSQDGSSPVEEPIVLNKLFQNASRDIDALFPDPNLKKLLRDVALMRRKNERFLKAISQNLLSPEFETEGNGE
jgi:hypothetical protein